MEIPRSRSPCRIVSKKLQHALLENSSHGGPTYSSKRRFGKKSSIAEERERIQATAMTLMDAIRPQSGRWRGNKKGKQTEAEINLVDDMKDMARREVIGHEHLNGSICIPSVDLWSTEKIALTYHPPVRNRRNWNGEAKQH